MGGSRIGTADPGLVSPAPTIPYVLPPTVLLLVAVHDEHIELLSELALCRYPRRRVPESHLALLGRRGNGSEVILSSARVDLCLYYRDLNVYVYTCYMRHFDHASITIIALFPASR